jgi:predicted NAD-dependent protein-ADP-ribosyltransferase YbiA (DUF1768 family)
MGGAVQCNNEWIKEFDNFFPCEIEYYQMSYGYDEKLLPWKSAEQLYQALKFLDLQHVYKINQAENLHLAYMLGQQRNKQTVELTEENRVRMMYIANREKFIQNKILRKLLIDSYPYKIYTRGSTNFWNIENSKILEMIRDEVLE